MLRTPLSIFLLISLAIRLAKADQRYGICCLCEGCANAAPGRGSLLVTSTGGTCDKMALDMADPSTGAPPGSGKCKSLQGQYRQSCCDPNYNPHVIAQQPTPAPKANMPPGSEPHCDLCVDGSFPGRPNTVTAILYMPGNPTCKDLYWMGRTGNIPDRLCNALVDYMEVPCACKSGSSGGGGGSSGGGGGGGNGGGGGGGGNFHGSVPIRKTPPPDTKKKLYKGRVRGVTRLLLRGLNREEDTADTDHALPVSRR